MLYKVSDHHKQYVLKVSRRALSSEIDALKDEFETMRQISHPVLPKYYAFDSSISVPGLVNPVPGILMEYIDGIPLTSIHHLTTKQLKKYILDLGSVLFTLLQNGVLYMDLHPGNLLIREEEIILLDFTKAYYYITNPNPSYNPKISYQINQHLPGQQILIQVLTNFFLHLPEHFPVHTFPTSLLQLGLHPHKGISFSDFLTKIEKEWIF